MNGNCTDKFAEQLDRIMKIMRWYNEDVLIESAFDLQASTF